MKSQFLKQLRSAATPGAHKRQLEILYPTSLSISIDIHAPKLWIPVSSSTSDGALYIDAGKLKMGAIKPSKSSSTRWGIELCDIQIKFAREDFSIESIPGKLSDTIDLVAVNRLDDELTIVYPFHIGVTGISNESVEIPIEDFSMDTSGYEYRLYKPNDEPIAGEVFVAVGKVNLNLVDVEGKIVLIHNTILLIVQPMSCLLVLFHVSTCKGFRTFLRSPSNSIKTPVNKEGI